MPVLPSAKPAKPPEAEPDFRALFGDVRPLKDGNRVPPYSPKPSPRPRKPDRQTPLPPELEAALLASAVGWFEPAELDRHFARSGMPATTLRRLRGGHWPVVAELDLHGLDRYQAQDRLTLFLHRARSRGQCVRIIHGKGFGSRGEPVLKRMVRSWLKHHPEVLAFCEADERQGGSGALMVLLRRPSLLQP
ncbi:Smr/MutS family protein [Pseudogulbenkiania sp. MAI-1]|uniref:Smr/MutS family protein n=1 Tax=Pseudogulbenkiania sp. MAI-1 TaxID=990370 RepID=UPI0004BB50F4|nr:Smr/MutS family protein [Pseudogulbenkiania sp. MAI-1]